VISTEPYLKLRTASRIASCTAAGPADCELPGDPGVTLSAGGRCSDLLGSKGTVLSQAKVYNTDREYGI